MTMQEMASHGVVVLFTDSPTKNHQLENEIISYGKEKDIDVIVVLAPKYKAQVGDTSWQVYQKVSQERVFEMETSDFDHLRLLGEVSQLVGKNCLAGMNLSVHFIAMFSTARGNWTEEILPFILPDFNISDEAVSIIETR